MEPLRYAHSEGHTDVCYSDDSKFIVTCGSEGDVRVWSSIEDADQQDLCVGEQAWAVAQKGSSLYVGTDNNTVQIYTFPKLSNDGIIARFTAPPNQIQVSKDGKTVAIGSCDMEIHIVDVESMECTKLIDHVAPILGISLDPESKYLVSSGCDGVVKVWSISSRDIVKQWDGISKSNSFERAESLCRMDFSPLGDILAVPFGSVIRIYERDSWHQSKSFSCNSSTIVNIVRFSPSGQFLACGTTTGDLVVWEVSNERLVKTNTGQSKYAITGLSWKKDSLSFVFVNSMGQLGNADIPPQPSFVESEEETPAVPSNLDDVPIPEPVFDDDDEDGDHENTISLEKIKSQTLMRHDSRSNSPSRDSEKKSYTEVKYIQRESELQEPFQPSSTPNHLQQRFMVWNSAGIIRQFNAEDAEEIDIEYHDTTQNHGLRLNNVAGHTMATLTTQAAVLACPKSDDGGPSKVLCILMKSWDGTKEWDCLLPDDEEVIGLASGDGWVAVICDSLILRLFTFDGTQVDITSIPGPFVSAAGNGQQLAVIFHSGVGLDSQQCLFYSEMTVDPYSKLLTVEETKPLPLTPKSLLRWIGYSDEESLCTVDSNGTLRIFYRGQWKPICCLDNQVKSEFDHFFVVGVSETSQNIRCILCKGSYYPPVLPKPLVNEIKWQMPLCELESEKGKLEEDYMRNRIVLTNTKDETILSGNGKNAVEKTISITIMKLFALACRSGLESRALSLCESMPNADVVKLASKYAAKIGRQNLASKVNEIAANMYKLREGPTGIEQHTSDGQSQRDVYSQDMFEDGESVAREKENFIMKMQQIQKEKKERVSPKPMRILKTGNPFRKAQENESKNNSTLNKSINSDNRMTFMEWYEDNRHRLQEENPLLKEGELAVFAMKQYRQNATNSNEDQSQKTNKSLPQAKQTKLLDESGEEGNSMGSEGRKRKAVDCDDEKPKKKLNSLAKLKNFSFTKAS